VCQYPTVRSVVGLTVPGSCDDYTYRISEGREEGKQIVRRRTLDTFARESESTSKLIKRRELTYTC
jgi:hypothetical protein